MKDTLDGFLSHYLPFRNRTVIPLYLQSARCPAGASLTHFAAPPSPTQAASLGLRGDPEFIWPTNALLFLATHKVCLRKSAFLPTQIFSKSALAELCGIAYTQSITLEPVFPPARKQGKQAFREQEKRV